MSEAGRSRGHLSGDLWRSVVPPLLGLPHTYDSVRPLLGALTEARDAASTRAVTTASTPALRSERAPPYRTCFWGPNARDPACSSGCCRFSANALTLARLGMGAFTPTAASLLRWTNFDIERGVPSDGSFSDERESPAATASRVAPSRLAESRARTSRPGGSVSAASGSSRSWVSRPSSGWWGGGGFSGARDGSALRTLPPAG